MLLVRGIFVVGRGDLDRVDVDPLELGQWPVDDGACEFAPDVVDVFARRIEEPDVQGGELAGLESSSTPLKQGTRI